MLDTTRRQDAHGLRHLMKALRPSEMERTASLAGGNRTAFFSPFKMEMGERVGEESWRQPHRPFSSLSAVDG